MKNLILWLIAILFFFSCEKEQNTTDPSSSNNTNGFVESFEIDSFNLEIIQDFMFGVDSGLLDSVYDFNDAMFMTEASINAKMTMMDTDASAMFEDSFQLNISMANVGEERLVTGEDLVVLFDELYTWIDEYMEVIELPGDLGSEDKFVRAIDIVWDTVSTASTQYINIKFQYTSFYFPLSSCQFTDDWYGFETGGCGSHTGSPYQVTDLMDFYLNNHFCNEDKACVTTHILEGQGTKRLFPVAVTTMTYLGFTYYSDMWTNTNTFVCLNAVQIDDYTNGSNYISQTYAPGGGSLSTIVYNLMPDVIPGVPQSLYFHSMDVVYGKCVFMEAPFSSPPVYD